MSEANEVSDNDWKQESRAFVFPVFRYRHKNNPDCTYSAGCLLNQKAFMPLEWREYEGQIRLFGGALERKENGEFETPLEAAKRELSEELPWFPEHQIFDEPITFSEGRITVFILLIKEPLDEDALRAIAGSCKEGALKPVLFEYASKIAKDMFVYPEISTIMNMTLEHYQSVLCRS